MKLIDILVQELPKRGGWPDGAADAWQSTHDGEVYFCKENGEYSEENNGGSKWYFEIASDRGGKHGVTAAQYEAALAASQKVEWDGEGLPPVGVEFEYLRGDFGADEGRWIKCTMKYAGDKFCIVHLEGEGESWLKHEGTKIRPIRSEAGKKKEVAIFAIADLCRNSASNGHSAELIYDAIKSGKIVID